MSGEARSFGKRIAVILREQKRRARALKDGKPYHEDIAPELLDMVDDIEEVLKERNERIPRLRKAVKLLREAHMLINDDEPVKRRP